jgi:hypothetical protein
MKLKISWLWGLREFDREDPKQKFEGFLDSSDYTIKKIEDELKAGGEIKKPVELVVHEGKGLLIQGNHRIIAAKNAGHEEIPTTVVFAGKNSKYLKLKNKFKKL